jgi:phage terminase large subunit GpA-like protein
MVLERRAGTPAPPSMNAQPVGGRPVRPMEVLASAFAPRERLTVPQWADKYRVLGGKDGLRTGRWKSAAVPYMVEIADRMGDSRFPGVVVMKPAQVGFTELLINFIGWSCDVRPGPIMLAMPAADSLTVVMGRRGRIAGAVDLCPHWAKRLPDTQWFRSTGVLRFDTLNLYGVGSGSPRQGQSKQCQSVICDDVQSFAPGFIEYTRARTTAYTGRHKHIDGGTPTTEGDGVHALYLQGDQRCYFVPCPKCGCFQMLSFSGIRWKGGLERGPDHAAATARYQCCACKQLLESGCKQEMLERGVWLPTREGILPEGMIQGNMLTVPVAEAVKAEKAAYEAAPWQTCSYWITGAMNCFEPWGKLAYEFVRYNGRPPRQWWNERCGHAYREAGESLDPNAVRAALMVPVSLGGYQRGTVPPGVLMLACGADLQIDRLVWEVAGYGEKGLRATIQIGVETARDQAELEAAVAKIAAMTFRLHAKHPYKSAGVEVLRVSGGAVDSGQGGRHQIVYNALRHRAHWFALKGVHPWHRAVSTDLSRPEKGPDGKTSPKSIWLLRIDSHHFKGQNQDQLRASIMPVDRPAAGALGQIQQPAAGELAESGHHGGRWLMPEDPEGQMGDWLAQLTSEERVRGTVAGRSAYVWRTKMSGGANHAFDAACYADAVAELLKLREHRAVDILGKLRVGVGKGGGGGEKRPHAERGGTRNVGGGGGGGVQRGLVDRGGIEG